MEINLRKNLSKTVTLNVSYFSYFMFFIIPSYLENFKFSEVCLFVVMLTIQNTYLIKFKKDVPGYQKKKGLYCVIQDNGLN